MSRNNVKLMKKLKQIDEGAIRLQAMLRENTASFPGSQIPDKAHEFHRSIRDDIRQDIIEATAAHDFSPKRPELVKAPVYDPEVALQKRIEKRAKEIAEAAEKERIKDGN